MSRATPRLACLVSLAVAAAVLPVVAAPSASAVAGDPAVFVNELHYDNVGTDTDEFVEIAGPVGTDLTGWSLVLYNGGGSPAGASYSTRALPSPIPSTGVVVVEYATNGIQNGSPDGLALVDAAGAVVQFLSYEGAFTASNGPASGLQSTDIGVQEIGSAEEPAGQSLQLTGQGNSYADFTWSGPAPSTKAQPNAGQTFVAPSGPPAPVATCPADVMVRPGQAASADATAQDADSSVIDGDVSSTPASAGITRSRFTPSGADGQPATATAGIGPDTPTGSYDVEVLFTTDDAENAACTFTVEVRDPDAVTLISAIQGTGAVSPRDGQPVNVEAVVTSLFTRADVLSGFFVQEQDADADGDPATSEGLFVFCGSACPAGLASGDLVRVGGVVDEFFGMTQVDASAGSVTLLSSGNPLPAPTPVALPAAGSTRDAATFEPVEGMITTFSATLAVSEYFQLARYGQLTLTAGGRPYQYSHLSRPTPEGYAAHLAELNTRRIYLDDDNNDQNDATSGPASNEPYPYPSGGLSVDNRFRGGDTITGLTGVLHWSFAGSSGTDAWRVRPVATEQYAFDRVHPRPAAPAAVGGRLKAASFNVLNYFTTIDTTPTNTGTCAPSGTADCRGADSARELERQRAKIVDALARMDADVVGLIEIQNDADVSLADLVAALNADGRAGTYDYVRTGTIGTDAIKVAFIYRPASVSLVGAFQVLDSSDDPRFVDTRSRPALVQTFAENATGEQFTAAINHFKSKGSACEGDPNRNDGAGNCNATRTDAARALADFLATDPTGSGDPDVLILGDLNAYRMEDPIVALRDAGYTDLIDRFGGATAYGYVFDGQLGYLDHALADADLLSQVTGATEWHANADEPPLLDYNDEVRDAGEATFERKSAARPLYEPNAYRSSDHDAVVVGLALGSGATAPGQGAGEPVIGIGSPEPSASPSAAPSAAPSAPPSAAPSASPASASPTSRPTAPPSSPSPLGPPQDACSVPASVTLERSTIIATGSTGVTVRATPNSVVDLYAYTQPSRTFRIVRSAEVGGNGLADFRIVPPANTRLYAQQRSCGADPARDSVVLNVRTALSLAVKRNGPRDYTFTGDSLPARRGGLIVSLYRITPGGAQVLTAQARADARTGDWRIDRRFTGTGRFGFVVRTGQDLLNAPGASNVRSLLVF